MYRALVPCLTLVALLAGRAGAQEPPVDPFAPLKVVARAFVDAQFKGRDEFWRVSVHPGDAAPDPADIPQPSPCGKATMPSTSDGNVCPS